MSILRINRGAHRPRRPVVVWLTIIMTLLSLSPVGFEVAAAQPQPGSDVQPALAQTGEPASLEIHVSACPPGTTAADGGVLYNTCHSNGAIDVPVTITGGTVNLTNSTAAAPGGYGVVNTGDIAAGDYAVSVDIPGDMNSFFVYCSEAASDALVTANPNNATTAAAQTTVTMAGVDAVCDVYVLPQGGAQPDTATLTFDVRACDRTALSGDDRSWEQLSANCTGMPDPAFELELTPVGGTATRETVDPQGVISFDGLPDGDYQVSSNVNLNNAGEYLFCEYAGQPRYQKQFDTTGMTTFTDMQGEEIACDWFVVNVPAPTPTSPPPATLGSITTTLRSCPQGYDVATAGTGYATFQQNCAAPVSDVVMTLTDSQGGQTQLPTDGNGVAAFPNLEPDTFTLYSGIPLEAASEYVFCSIDGQPATPKELSDRGVATFTDLETEQVACDWYVVPEDLRGEENGGSLTVHLSACPTEYSGDKLFADCHGNGIADQQFTLSGPSGELTGTTEVPQTPGPGITTFTELSAGDYTLAGGPPGDFGTVQLYCSDQTTNERVDASVESIIATFAIGENQDILCDWYYVPENASGITPTPTPTQPARAEILVTLYECAETNAASGYAGATYQQLGNACQTPVNDVAFSLSSQGGPPISAPTGVSGDGAVRFYDLVPADYTLVPSLPSDLTSAAVFCRIGDGDVYQKTIQNGATTFVNVGGEQISCDWFAAPVRQPQPSGPTGSITVREYLCEKDRSEIQDWERECAPGSTGTSFTLTSADGAINQQATPNAQGVLVFGQLPDGFYDLKQDDGVWCRAAAERVDSRSRLIVRDGGNTDVFIYECGQVNALPNTGSGTTQGVDGVRGGMLPSSTIAAALLLMLAVPTLAAGMAHARRPAARAVPVEEAPLPRRTRAGTHWIRFR